MTGTQHRSSAPKSIGLFGLFLLSSLLGHALLGVLLPHVAEPPRSGPSSHPLIWFEAPKALAPPPIVRRSPVSTSPSTGSKATLATPKQRRERIAEPEATSAPTASPSTRSPVPSEPTRKIGPPALDKLTPWSVPSGQAIAIDEGPSASQVPGDVPAPRAQGLDEMLLSGVQHAKVDEGVVDTYFLILRDALQKAWRGDAFAAQREHEGLALSGRSRPIVVHLEQDANGVLKQIAIRFSSRWPAMDRALVADLNAAAGQMPTPPAYLFRQRTTLRSTWSFEYVVRTGPPLNPLVPMHFDLMDLIDRKAIPPPATERVQLLSLE